MLGDGFVGAGQLGGYWQDFRARHRWRLLDVLAWLLGWYSHCAGGAGPLGAGAPSRPSGLPQAAPPDYYSRSYAAPPLCSLAGWNKQPRTFRAWLTNSLRCGFVAALVHLTAPESSDAFELSTRTLDRMLQAPADTGSIAIVPHKQAVRCGHEAIQTMCLAIEEWAAEVRCAVLSMYWLLVGWIGKMLQAEDGWRASMHGMASAAAVALTCLLQPLPPACIHHPPMPFVYSPCRWASPSVPRAWCCLPKAWMRPSMP